MSGMMSIEQRAAEETVLVFRVKNRTEVMSLTLDLMDAGLEVLYEPRERATGYESAVICGDGLYMRIVA